MAAELFMGTWIASVCCDNCLEFLLDGIRISAGTEDTSINLRWVVLLLALHPEVQETLQHHIDAVIGHSRAPAVFDRPSLTYLEAVLLESTRYSSAMPLPLPHRVTEDTAFMSYQIPKGPIRLTFENFVT